MYNEWLGLVAFLVTFILMVLMFRLFGKAGLYAWVAIGTIIANIQVLKTVDIFMISATLGNIMFASIYLATDVLNDIYGRKVAKRAVWLGFSSTLVMIIVMQISLSFQPSDADMAQNALKSIFDVVPRIAFASIIAYIIGQHIDVFVFNVIKRIFKSDRTFFIRAYGSTTLSSIFDTALFVFIAFYGSLPKPVIFEIFITTYLLKLLSTILNVPFGYWAKSLYRKGKIKDDGY
ncbi:queuosine precursor transporter [Staphylococcus coagulans]|uniref:queuosine precursor transporter n=1 Tax=Staphylococcus coagulans TaxID=74706 RepID=UPI001BE86017|nr:queuosine precursor transporter [Staphylococcus coagulans]MBT2813887.1 queuosine precursor transporter [Staphylococcus coagulans]MBT2816206.1 queuosine precursor transporter [Staphylococcus coagulans]MBT2836461.1 queuosine precursor transporter [Staphylococcus coagulans]MBT2840989.1 queuosine precursor transporter [Staphylococcus coagulans]MBT2848112.1 queuosine precursor transporter [Staphylococcus coagulans]